MREHIWTPKVTIPIIGLTGEHSSGKTRFGISIDPESTCYYDSEKSGSTYHQQYGIKTYIDLPQEVTNLKLKHNPKSDGSFTNKELFLFWLKHQRATVRRDAYTVCFIDPINDLESGLTDWVASRYGEFGYHTEAKFRSTGGLFLSQVNGIWKQILLNLASRCQTLVYTTHTKMQYIGNQPQKNAPKLPKGKGVLQEIATVYFKLERDKNTDNPPSATFVKPARLESYILDPDLDEYVSTPMFPPRIPRFTPGSLRKYMMAPPNFKKLKPEEIAPDETNQLTEDEKLLIRKEIAENERVKAEASAPARSATTIDKETDEAAKRMRGQSTGGREIVTEAQQTAAKEKAKVTADPTAEQTLQALFDKATALGVYDRTADYVVKLLAKRGIQVATNDDLKFLAPEDLTKVADQLAKVAASKGE